MPDEQLNKNPESPILDDGKISVESKKPVLVEKYFGDVDQAHPSQKPKSEDVSWQIFWKNFQVKVLMMLCIFIIILLIIDVITSYLLPGAQNGKDYITSVLTYILPLFTFVLGMGTRPPNQ
jgi:hypothetical protein